jgi:hypothetical protein
MSSEEKLEARFMLDDKLSPTDELRVLSPEEMLVEKVGLPRGKLASEDPLNARLLPEGMRLERRPFRKAKLLANVFG